MPILIRAIATKTRLREGAEARDVIAREKYKLIKKSRRCGVLLDDAEADSLLEFAHD